LSTTDRLIVAGVVTIPAAFAVIALTVTNADSAFALIWASVALGAGLITTGILMRKNRS